MLILSKSESSVFDGYLYHGPDADADDDDNSSIAKEEEIETPFIFILSLYLLYFHRVCLITKTPAILGYKI